MTNEQPPGESGGEEEIVMSTIVDVAEFHAWMYILIDLQSSVLVQAIPTKPVFVSGCDWSSQSDCGSNPPLHVLLVHRGHRSHFEKGV